MKKWIALLCAACLLLSGCGKKDPEETSGTTEPAEAEPAIVDFAQSEQDMFTDRDLRTAF